MHETNITLSEFLKLTSETIKEMSRPLDATMKKMSGLTIQMNVRETVLKSFRLGGMIPNLLIRKI